MSRSKKQQRARGAHRIWLVIGMVVIAAILAFVVQHRPAQQNPRQPNPAQQAVPLKEGSMVGDAVFPMGDTPQGGQGQTVNTVQCNTTEQLVYHNHAHLSLFVNGKQVAVPANIGILQLASAGPGAGKGCVYWLHTHDATGIIHIESPVNKTFTLGDLFAVWGQPLSGTNLAGNSGTVTAYVDGKPYTGDPAAIPLAAHTQITLEVGQTVKPPVYTLPAGL